MSDGAEPRGLTDEILDAELAAYNADKQRRGVAISEPVMTELLDVLFRPGLARFIRPERRSELLGQLVALGNPFEPVERMTDCRDPKDDKYLELALAADAERIVSSDQDLLVLHPWRGTRIAPA